MQEKQSIPTSIAIGSLNPAKVAAVKMITSRVWPNTIIQPVAVDSGVSNMPMTAEETLRGAKSRANAALRLSGADMGIGLEGGVDLEPPGLMLSGWVVIVDKYGRSGVGGTSRVLLPPHIASRVLEGEELGLVMDDILDEINVKQREGAVGALTGGLITRSEEFATAVAFALGPFLDLAVYQE